MQHNLKLLCLFGLIICIFSAVDISSIQPGEQVVYRESDTRDGLYEQPLPSRLEELYLAEVFNVESSKWQLVISRRKNSSRYEIPGYNPNQATINRKLMQQAGQYQDYYGFESVIFDDEREEVKNTSLFPFSAISHIYFLCRSASSARSICTGTLIGPRTVLTAGHCIHNFNGNIKDSPGEMCGDYSVSPGRQKDYFPYGNSSVVQIIAAPQWESNQSRISDYGLLILSNPLGLQTGWMSVSIDCFQTMYENMVVAGYPFNKNGAFNDGITMVSTACDVELDACKNNVSDGEFFHTCDTEGGQSGSAMWIVDDKGNRVIRGVHVRGVPRGQTTDGKNAGVYISVDNFFWIQQFRQ